MVELQRLGESLNGFAMGRATGTALQRPDRFDADTGLGSKEFL
jgi:hypothetical protein